MGSSFLFSLLLIPLSSSFITLSWLLMAFTLSFIALIWEYAGLSIVFAHTWLFACNELPSVQVCRRCAEIDAGNNFPWLDFYFMVSRCFTTFMHYFQSYDDEHHTMLCLDRWADDTLDSPSELSAVYMHLVGCCLILECRW